MNKLREMLNREEREEREEINFVSFASFAVKNLNPTFIALVTAGDYKQISEYV